MCSFLFYLFLANYKHAVDLIYLEVKHVNCVQVVWMAVKTAMLSYLAGNKTASMEAIKHQR